MPLALCNSRFKRNQKRRPDQDAVFSGEMCLLLGWDVQSIPVALADELRQLAIIIGRGAQTVAHTALGIECDLADILFLDLYFLFQLEIVKFDSHSALTYLSDLISVISSVVQIQNERKRSMDEFDEIL
jgi:hypothetical protein